jgi:quinol monooxygenase YgiN
MNTITVVANFEARPGRETDLRSALVGLVAPTRKEDGCINYDLHGSPEHPGRFLFHENWTSQAALETHLQSPHVQALLPRVSELCSEPPAIVVWNRIA